jgi:transposase
MTSELMIENLEHLGLIAVVIDELGLVELLDGLFPPHPQNQITTGQVVRAMILNCLGLLSASIYLFSEFFESKPLEHLLGDGIEASHLNDDRIGRVLDQLCVFRLNSLFVRLAMAAVAKFGVSVNQTHLDSS